MRVRAVSRGVYAVGPAICLVCQNRFLARCFVLGDSLIRQRANTRSGICPLLDSLLFQALISRIMHGSGHLCQSWHCLLASSRGTKESTGRVPSLPPKCKRLFREYTHITQTASCCISTLCNIYRKRLFAPEHDSLIRSVPSCDSAKQDAFWTISLCSHGKRLFECGLYTCSL